MYGIPLRILNRKDKNKGIIASVAFATQMYSLNIFNGVKHDEDINYLMSREADNAVIGLDDKPPLYWKVGYSLDHCAKHDSNPGFSDAPMLPLQDTAQLNVAPFTQAVVPFAYGGIGFLTFNYLHPFA